MIPRLLACAALSAFALVSHAQGWPQRPVKMIVPFPAGGPTDVLTRVLADKASQGEMTGGTPQQFAAVIQQEAQRWSKVIRDANVKPE